MSAPLSVTSISQTYSLAVLLRTNTAQLLTTYHKYQGSPFSDRGLSDHGLQLTGLPVAAASFCAWRQQSVEERLGENFKAYSAYIEFLRLVTDDQTALNPTALDLLKLLRKTHSRIRMLVGKLAGLMTGLGLTIPEVAVDRLPAGSLSASDWERKIRGYAVCLGLTNWLERTVRDLTFLKKKHRQ
ncbi:cardiotrophin-2-like [Acipenser ruthenus]|uniref:cardiotrophin-2-like n=1 Tax=Acipenser ruthenus TaxID=7906 RepID=UPI0027404D2B|nr:cardiotrophin-2-like [Acipenser ruthenus]